MRPIPWVDIDPHNYDAILVVGGQAPGIKPYLESRVLQEKLTEFWKLNKAVAAIGYGNFQLWIY
jgi:putative intracellular protease/amidase